MSNNADDKIWINADDFPIKEKTIQKTSKYPSPICDSRTYQNLKEELLVKCEPKNFYDENYDHDKVNAAIDLIDEIKRTNDNDISMLNRLRKSAMEKLGVKFVTKDLYEKLLGSTNPDDFDDIETKHLINDYHLKVLMAADNIEELESYQEAVYNISSCKKHLDLLTELQSLNIDDAFLIEKEAIIENMPLLSRAEMEERIKALSDRNKIYKRLTNFPIEKYKIFNRDKVEHFNENLHRDLSLNGLKEFENQMNNMMEDIGLIALLLIFVVIPLGVIFYSVIHN